MDLVRAAFQMRYWALAVASAVVWSVNPAVAAAPSASAGKPNHDRAMATAVPQAGHRSKISFSDSLVKLVRAGVIDARKIEALYVRRETAAALEVKKLITESSSEPMFLTRENAALHVSLLWPLGLANRMGANRDSPLNGPHLSRFASTGGWRLGRDENGAAYFNQFPIVALTPGQESLVTRIALNVFRPCCNNSTFFQDCNHGSALLGLLALGAAQGLDEKALYREALAFNSFWFPHHYAHIALYFKTVKATEWPDVDPRDALSVIHSSADGWRTNVTGELARRGLVPEQGGANCDV